MSDLYVDGEMLDRIKKNLKKIENLLEKPAKAMKDVSPKEVGVPELEARMDAFCEEWGYGIDQIKKTSGKAISELKKIEDAYNEVDTKLADSLKHKDSKK